MHGTYLEWDDEKNKTNKAELSDSYMPCRLGFKGLSKKSRIFSIELLSSMMYNMGR